jgi:secretion/DNA translocation related TadE-like protein
LSSDRGSASLLVLGAGSVLAVVALGVGLVATGLTVHRQAVRAADLAALAGAHRSLVDASAACETAREVAVANGAFLVSCRLDPAALQVEVSIDSSSWLPAIAASARAGQRGRAHG